MILDTYYILGAISLDNMVRHVRTMRRVLLDTYYTLGATSAGIIVTSGSFSFSLTSLESLQMQQKRTSGAGFYSSVNRTSTASFFLYQQLTSEGKESQRGFKSRNSTCPAEAIIYLEKVYRRTRDVP